MAYGISIIIILIIHYLSYAYSDTDTKCSNGTCKKIYDCKVDGDDLNKLKLCGFNGTTPVVCCPYILHLPISQIQETNDKYAYHQLPSPGVHETNIHYWLNRLSSSRQPPPMVGEKNWPDEEFQTKDFNYDFEKQLSVSERKCKEIEKIVSRRIDAMFYSTTGHIISQDIPNCDFTNVPFIVGGEAAKVNEFPHMAVLGYGNGPNYNFRCGGTLISENFILTAAHCTKTYSFGDPTIVRLGEINLITSDDGAEPIDIKVFNVFIHPEYNPPEKYNDIALIKLERNVDFNKKIYPACLATKLQQYYVQKVLATGWGKTAFYEDSSNILLKVLLPIINSNECDKLWANIIKSSKLSLPRGLDHDIMICAGDLKGGRDACSGDSGGPITVPNDKIQCVHHVLGIISFGSYCGFASPGIYTKLYNYIPWIESIVWPGQ